MSKRSWNPEPKDDKQWWQRSHCGPGSIDPNGICGFCGEEHKVCAEKATKSIKDHHLYDPEEMCGGCGFSCTKCHTFYPQDSCGEQDEGWFKSFSGKTLSIKNDIVYCSCGEMLYPVPEQL